MFVMMKVLIIVSLLLFQWFQIDIDEYLIGHIMYQLLIIIFLWILLQDDCFYCIPFLLASQIILIQFTSWLNVNNDFLCSSI